MDYGLKMLLIMKHILLMQQKLREETIKNVTISIYNKDFDILKIISSNTVDISRNDWVIKKPTIFVENNSFKSEQDII